MITSLTLKNFKPFGEHEVEIPFAPLTLVYGPNSAGKSSVIQALRLLQGNYQQKIKYPYDAGDIGPYEELVYNHDLERDISIKVAFALPTTERFTKYMPAKGFPECAFTWDYSFEQGVRLKRQLIEIGNEPRFSIDVNNALLSIKWLQRDLERKLHSKAIQSPKFSGDFDQFMEILNSQYISSTLIGKKCNDWRLISSSGSTVTSSDLVRPVVTQEFEDLWSLFTDTMLSIRHIGPQRHQPERVYRTESLTDLDENPFTSYVGISGEHFVDLLHNDPELLQTTNAWLEKLGVTYNLKLDREKNTEELRLLLADSRKDRKNPLDVTLPQVGYGISQLLPIIVQSILSRNDSILIEQPELHIHPKLQADLGDLFVKCIRKPHHNQFLIETHSENLVLRLLRRIRETTEDNLENPELAMTPDDLNILYILPTATGSECKLLRVDETGEFVDRWPKGFFEERAEELF